MLIDRSERILESVSDLSSFSARFVSGDERAAVRELAAAAGAHGVYMRNFLAEGGSDGEGGELLGFHGSSGLAGVAFFGSRGNLILIMRDVISPENVARAISASGIAWRIVLGPPESVAAIERREENPPLVFRSQIYYAAAPQDVAETSMCEGVRLAVKRDLAELVKAALDLNRTDLNMNPRKVFKPWLKESIKRRISEERVWVIGSSGKLLAKLDVGSVGPAGMMVEGVYTSPDARGRGLASGLVAAVARQSADRYPLVCLHVGADNAPARRAYERAGLQEAGQCSLLLRS